jgi:hypothetical protein
MMYVLTEEEYFQLSESRNDMPKLKTALKKECEEIRHQIDIYKQLGSDNMVRDLRIRLNTTLIIIDKYL